MLSELAKIAVLTPNDLWQIQHNYVVADLKCYGKHYHYYYLILPVRHWRRYTEGVSL